MNEDVDASASVSSPGDSGELCIEVPASYALKAGCYFECFLEKIGYKRKKLLLVAFIYIS